VNAEVNYWISYTAEINQLLLATQ